MKGYFQGSEIMDAKCPSSCSAVGTKFTSPKTLERRHTWGGGTRTTGARQTPRTAFVLTLRVRAQTSPGFPRLPVVPLRAQSWASHALGVLRPLSLPSGTPALPQRTAPPNSSLHGIYAPPFISSLEKNLLIFLLPPCLSLS